MIDQPPNISFKSPLLWAACVLSNVWVQSRQSVRTVKKMGLINPCVLPLNEQNISVFHFPITYVPLPPKCFPLMNTDGTVRWLVISKSVDCISWPLGIRSNSCTFTERLSLWKRFFVSVQYGHVVLENTTTFCYKEEGGGKGYERYSWEKRFLGFVEYRMESVHFFFQQHELTLFVVISFLIKSSVWLWLVDVDDELIVVPMKSEPTSVECTIIVVKRRDNKIVKAQNLAACSHADTTIRRQQLPPATRYSM